MLCLRAHQHSRSVLVENVEKENAEEENVEMVDLFLLIDNNICCIDLEWKRPEKIDKIIAPNLFFFPISNDKPYNSF